jgi:1,4-dihydroxy-2-naphthoate octaprenyltransferase
MGFLAVAILVANNLRDIRTDEAAGKRTLAVRLGDRRTRVFYRACVVAAFAVVALGVAVGIVDPARGMPGLAALALVASVAATGPIRRVAKAQGRDLIAVLVGTARLQLVFGALLALGLWIAGASAP